jgi:hypothetical protein
MKHNHIEEILLIIAANAFAIYVVRYFHIYGIWKLTFPFHALASGDFFQALIYSTPFLFYVLAALIFLRKKEILVSHKKLKDQEKD